jgi:hypothetical protein
MVKHVEIFSETLKTLSKELIENEIEDILKLAREKFEEALMKERVRLMSQVQYHLRQDMIGDRIIYTLEFKPAK